MSALISSPQAVRVVLRGKFWDSQLYAGTLFLFGLSGDLSRISWDQLVTDLPVPDELRVVTELALLGNHRLYEPGARLLMRDPDIHALLIRKFQELSAASPWEVQPVQVTVQDNPLPFPHNDSEVHYQSLYVAASEGVYSLPTVSTGKDLFRLSEVPTFNIAAKYQTIAQAGGSEGLFAVHIGNESGASNAHHHSQQSHVSKLPCMVCEWASSSVIVAGFDNSVYVAPYKVDSPKEGLRRRHHSRRFDDVILEADIFGDRPQRSEGFTWGAGDKIFRLEDGNVEVVHYGQNKKNKATFTGRGGIQLTDFRIANSVVSARAASFGSVIEGDDGLLVMLTTGDSLSLPGEPTNWRVFPRSKNYLNHLHIIYDDRLEIWAFTHDYFVDQRTKLAGLNVAMSD